MTIEEINQLTLEEVREYIEFRLYAELDPQPEILPEFTEEELQAEFTIYKQELLDRENERLRKEDLKQRFKDLSDLRLSFHTLHPDKSNPDAWFRDEVLKASPEDAEAKLAALESKDTELQSDPVKLDRDFKQARAEAYEAEGCTKEAMLEAIIEHLIENRPGKLVELQVKREAVKTAIPKPE